MTTPVIIDAPPGTMLIDVVRDLARDGQLPLYWRCGQGTCGACLVYLQHAGSNDARPITLSGKERNVLARKGLLSEAQRTAPTLADTPALPRLACHVALPAGPLTVSW
jgi:aerobic-type carbon monoxide dehydrogenase small subunit (CoxS/CutS family)